METTLTFIDYTSILQLEETGFDILCMNSFLIFKTTHVLWFIKAARINIKKTKKKISLNDFSCITLLASYHDQSIIWIYKIPKNEQKSHIEGD